MGNGSAPRNLGKNTTFDFSPIEETFSKVKTFLRQAGARTREALQEAICRALLTVTAQDARGWFRHCCYLPAKERV